VSSVIVISVLGSKSCNPNLLRRSTVTASVILGRTLRYAEMLSSPNRPASTMRIFSSAE
jgi:hypothetical protein